MKRFSFLLFFGLAAALAVWSFSAATAPVSSSRMLAVTSTPAAVSPTPLPTEALTPTPTLRPTATATPLPTLAPTAPPRQEPNVQTTPILPVLGFGEDSIHDPDEPSPVTRLIVPSLALDARVQRVPFDGVSWSVTGLGSAVGWLETSATPGNAGITVLAGHLTLQSGAEGPFRWLDHLKIGATVTVFASPTVYQYRVTRLVVIEASDTSLLEKGETSQLVLLTCYHPSWDPAGQFYRQRVAAIAELVSTAPWNSHP